MILKFLENFGKISMDRVAETGTKSWSKHNKIIHDDSLKIQNTNKIKRRNTR
jgi:hypothetical protein